jgi:hypothetical protein
VYYVLTSDYDQYMDINQRINFGIMEDLSASACRFAFPTTTGQVESVPKP